MVGFGSLSGTSSLFITVLQALIIATPGQCMRTTYHANRQDIVFLLAFRDSEGGVEVTAFPATENHDVQGRWSVNETQRIIIHGYKLSSDCGDFDFRCQDMLVTALIQEDGGRDINVIFVPLHNGVLLVSYRFDSHNATVEWDPSVIDIPVCNPTLFYTANSKIFTLCINSTRQMINVYEIRKLLPMIENVTLVGPLTGVPIQEPSISHLSSFVLDHENKVYFADKNTIYVINMQSNQTKNYSVPGCTQIYKLRLAESEQLLIAYCGDRYVLFNPSYGDFSSVYTYSKSGKPYLCPNKDYKAVLFNDTEGEHLHFTVADANRKVYNVSIGDGICFEVENQTYFTYSDQNHSCVFIYEFSSQNLYPALFYECSSTDCHHLFLLDDHYLIVHVNDNVYVLDAKTNFTLIMNTIGIPDTSIVTVIKVKIYHDKSYPTTVVTPFSHNFTTTICPFSDNFTTSIRPFSDNNTKIIVAAVTVLGTLIIVVILIAVLVAIPLRLIKKRR